MGTCSTLGIYKGNEIHYIYIATDGYWHGETLSKVGHDAIETLYNQIGDAEKEGNKVWLSHFFTDDVFKDFVARYKGGIKQMEADGIQTTARTPIIAAEPHWNKTFLKNFKDELSGVIKIVPIKSRLARRTHPFNIMDLFDSQGTAWLYDLGNDKIFFRGSITSFTDLKLGKPLSDVTVGTHQYLAIEV